MVLRRLRLGSVIVPYQLFRSSQRINVCVSPGQPKKMLTREPRYKQEVNTRAWKPEVLDALPFASFQTLASRDAAAGI